MRIAKWISDCPDSCGPAQGALVSGALGRDAQLDLLRGVAVAGMFFFSFVGTLSDALPMVLVHNFPGRLLIGDFVLSLFLFCSGISLAMVFRRYGTVYSLELWRKLGKRLSQMLLVSLFITPFSSGFILGMDEMMLNAVLTIPALLVISCGRFFIWSSAVGIWLAHKVLVVGNLVPSLPTEYLGGYALALFWLPIVLGGALVWSLSERALGRQVGVWGCFLAVALVSCGWPDKLSLSPSFGALSVLVGVFLLFVFRRYRARCSWLEYFGSKPLRMWSLMFVLLGPIRLYAESTYKKPILSFTTLQAVGISLAWMACCYGLSKLWDRLAPVGRLN